MVDFKLEHIARRFPRFTFHEPRTDGEFHVDCFGGRTRRRCMAPDRDLGPLRMLNLFAPSAFEEYNEWVDVLEAVDAAGETFTMIELGAGWGRWIVLAAVAARSIGKQVGTLTAVEAEPDHYLWTRQQFLDNGLDPDDHVLIRAAAAGEEGACTFYTGCADAWYGQSIAPGVRPTTPGFGREAEPAVRPERIMETVQEVPQVTLQSILRRYDSVDVLHSDIQGSELEVIEVAIEALTAKVRRVIVATHPPSTAGTRGRDVESALREIFTVHGWICLRDVPAGSKDVEIDGHCTEAGDGLQTWVNTRVRGDAKIL